MAEPSVMDLGSASSSSCLEGMKSWAASSASVSEMMCLWGGRGRRVEFCFESEGPGSDGSSVWSRGELYWDKGGWGTGPDDSWLSAHCAVVRVGVEVVSDAAVGEDWGGGYNNVVTA